MKKKIKRLFQVSILLTILITPGLFAQNNTEAPLINAVLNNISEVKKVLAERTGNTEMIQLLKTHGAQ